MRDSKKKIYCLGRKEWVFATPEELVRQQLFHKLTTCLNFPAGCIVLEKALKEMPHLSLSPKKMPKRRVDLICFAKGIHPDHDLYPLLIVECKAVKLTPRVINQVTGYNHFIQAKFIAVVNQTDVQFGWYDKALQDYRFLSHIPDYHELINL